MKIFNISFNWKLFWQRLRAMIRKELLASLKDPRTRYILIVPAILQSIIFGYGATYNLDTVPYALLDQSHSYYSSQLIARLEGSGIFNRVQTLQSSAQIASAIDSDEALLVINIAPDFADNITAGQSGQVQVISDGRNSTTSGIATGYVSSIVSQYNTDLRDGYSPVRLKPVVWYNPNLITRWMFLPALVPMLSLLQVMILSGLSVAREREQGTFDQLLVTPLSPLEILIGKAVPPVLVGLVQSTLILAIGVFWFEIPFEGTLFTLYLFLLVFLLSCVGIGLSISAISANMQQVMVYCFVLLMPMILLSGMATPIRNMPELLQYATYANPMRFAIETVRRIYLEGCGLADIAGNFLPLIIIAAVTMPMAAYLFRHKLS